MLGEINSSISRYKGLSKAKLAFCIAKPHIVMLQSHLSGGAQLKQFS